MIELKRDSLVFSFNDVHPDAKLNIEFQRTLRIPDDDNDYPLPPGLGRFPMAHVDDHADNVPPAWLQRGGVMLPMYQSEAMWLNFNTTYVADRATAYPFAIKVAAGKVNAVTGETWVNGLGGNPQDYMVAPKQPWLDGYCVEKGLIRQFVAMPLGSGYSAEEQITGQAEFGGVQIVAYPMKREVFERRFPKVKARMMKACRGIDAELAMDFLEEPCGGAAMGLAPGGRMKQEILDDPFDINDWDTEHVSRCFVHICNSMVWHAITGKRPPTTPPTAKQYNQAGLPWFEYYAAEAKALKGSDVLNKLKSVAEMGKAKGDVPLPENESVEPKHTVHLRQGLAKDQVREGAF